MKTLFTIFMMGLWLVGYGEGEATYMRDESGSNLHVSARLSATELEAGETFQVVLAVSEENSLFYFGAQVRFDPDFIDFVSGSLGELLEPGIIVAHVMSSERVGASVTRVSTDGDSGPGEILILSFRVREGVNMGQSVLEVLEPEARDADGVLIPVEVWSELSFEVVEGGGAGDDGDGSGDDDSGDGDGDGSGSGSGDGGGGEGDGGTGDGDGSGGSGGDDGGNGSGGDDGGSGDGDSGDGDGSGSGSDDGGDDSGEGDGDGSGSGDDGSGGFIDDPEPDMDIPIESHVLAAFQFEWLSNIASQTTFTNRDITFNLHGNAFTYANISGTPEGKALRTTGWAGKSDGSQYWHTTISTKDFHQVVMKWVQWGSNTGPRDFHIEGHAGDGIWLRLTEDPIMIPPSQNASSNHEIPFPESLLDQDEVIIRWIMASETSINGNSVSNAGTSLIGYINFIGSLAEEIVVVVRPGDTNNDGVVDEADVLALGTYWLSGGPKTMDRNLNWNRRAKQQWVPGMSTFADTNGDGVVDYRDLQPIGMFFGKSTVSSRISIRRLYSENFGTSEESRIRLMVHLPVLRFINGISGKIRLNSVDFSNYDIQLNPLFRLATDADSGNLIRWKHVSDNVISFAWTLKNSNSLQPIRAETDLFELIIESLSGDPINGELTIEDLILLDNVGYQHPLTEIDVVTIFGTHTEKVTPDVPHRFELIPAFPNPFNPGTTIGWKMPQPGRVTIKLWDITGREVMVLADKTYYNQVNYEYIDARNFSSGVYLVTIANNSHVLTQRIMLLK